MGWASGSSLADAVWDCVKDDLPDEAKYSVAKDLIAIFEAEDCDTMQESVLWGIVHPEGHDCSYCNQLRREREEDEDDK